MLHRFAFRTTDDGYLKVTAFAKGWPNVSAVHVNDVVFAAAVGLSGIPEPKSLELAAAARETFVNGGMDVCCETVDLTREQLTILCPQAGVGKLG
jgi:hypothetical protein